MLKKDIINELKKFGIDTSMIQSKDELERLLNLARAANKQVRPNRVYKPQYKEGRFMQISGPSGPSFWYGFAGVLLVILLVGFMLFNVSKTFHNNIAYVAGKIGWNIEMTKDAVDEEIVVTDEAKTDPRIPRIFEKNNQTYIVYDYPLINVTILQDGSCKRDACATDPLIQQIKTSITPLVKFKYVDYQSSEGRDLIQKFNLISLPVLIFDEHLNLTENFEKVQHFFSENNKKYLLQSEPYKILSGPDLTGSHFKGTDPNTAAVTLIEYSSFSCPHCKDSVEIVNQLQAKYPDQLAIYFKHYNRGGNDMLAALASECAADQNAFWQMHKKLFETQDSWIGESEAQLKTLLAKYASQLNLNKAEFNQCMKDEKYKDLITTNTEEAKKLGIENLPTFLLNQDILTGTYPVDQFSEWIDAILEASKIQ
ncbi:hypothetical protein COV81_05955 [Candidatus Peregrinibacteria bacterium CG11_big_fil_rev_8_21_14_0_20_41_10]|nr:MAG: hypothetical protein COV81_05955 [Candidatus Peregrinibacteria bacterium CG11_big_fil_rev_8_21_14_0_20_41_10]PIZ74909.1 MAG: hypothetical protein COY06_03495 [Candidatus Peregrinibacteria bacterium CG_4_10_14_0_2_um_filter_41_8]